MADRALVDEGQAKSEGSQQDHGELDALLLKTQILQLY